MEDLTNKDYYVYLLIDPRNNEVFYVGKGIHERAKQHQQEAQRTDKETDKLNRIKEILDEGYEVKEFIYSANNSEEEAFDKEDELINFYKTNYPGQLTNIQWGHRSIHTMSNEELDDIFGNAEPAVLGDERILFVKRNRSWNYKMTPEEHHEEFRGNWVVSKEKIDKIQLVCGVYNNVIKYVCIPTKWEFVKQRNNPRRKCNEYRFDGIVIKDHKYIGKSIKDFKKTVYDEKTNSYHTKYIFGHGQSIGYLNI